MSDTRTIYLLTQDNIYCSDPQIKQSSDLPLTYLDMSEFDNLNPTRGTIVSGLAGAVSTYEPYDATITLTFKNRQERAEWIQKNSEQVYQIAVANTISQKRVYNKKCAITSFEFVENPYTNGIQTVLTLKLFGKWQSSLTEMEINSGTYSGDTKSYTRDIQVRETDEGADGIAGKPEEDGRVPYKHTAWSWSNDGKDRFTTSYPGENLLANSAGPFKPIGRGTTDNFQIYSNVTIHLVHGETYMISGKTNGSFSSVHNGDSESDRIVLWFVNSSATTSVIVSSDTTGTTGTSFVWGNATGTYNLRVNTYHPASANTIYAENIKVESGKVATIYTPGPFKPIGGGTIDNFQIYSNVTIHLVHGETYMISGKTNGSFSSVHNGDSESDRIVLWFVNSSETTNVIVSSDTTGTTGTSFVWGNATGTYNLRVNTYHPASANTIYAENIKVESVKVATIYTPAPSEDHANAYPPYRGEYTDYTKADSTDPSVYTWGTPPVKKTYAYDSELRYGVTHYVSAIKLDGERGFVLATKPRKGGLTVNIKSEYNGHQFALESNWPDLITGLSSNFVAYPYTSFTALDRFTMLAGGAVTSYGWNIENNEMPCLYEMFNNVEKYPISVGAVDRNGTLVPIHVYTYTAQDFI